MGETHESSTGSGPHKFTCAFNLLLLSTAKLVAGRHRLFETESDLENLSAAGIWRRYSNADVIRKSRGSWIAYFAVGLPLLKMARSQKCTCGN